VIAEPNGAATWFPANDHPSDKATFRIAVTVSAGLTAISNGFLESSGASEEDGSRTWVWTMDEPMATYLATVVIDEFEIVESDPVGDVDVRDAIPESRSNDPQLDGLGKTHTQMLEYFESLFGAYPFDAYGIVLVDASLGVAMETQSISLFGAGVVDDVFMSHELAHQWFGDSVTPATWRDIWLNEGFATYAQWLWSDHTGARSVDSAAEEAHAGASTIDYRVDLADPGPTQLFDKQMYDRGALALHALRLTVGDESFFSTLRTWVDRYRYGNASIDDFVSVAEEVSGRQLDEFFADWLGPAEPPPLPR
jgi:aminopeptidase N